ncbi:hypothetical protein D3C80_881310 [compost metagenome]
MQDVEAAVGHHHLLAAQAGGLHGHLELGLGHDAKAGLLLGVEGVGQLHRAHCGGTQLAHHYAGGCVGQGAGLVQAHAGGKRRRQGGDDGIAGTGHVIDFVSLGRQVQLGLPFADQGHAILGTGHQQGVQLEALDQLQPLGDQLLFALHLAHHGLEFGHVGGQQGGAAILLEIRPLGIHQHRDAGGAGAGNHARHVVQGALAVVGEDHHVGPWQRLLHLAHQQAGVHVVEGLFEIEAQQLLVAGQHPQLGDGRVVGQTNEITGDLDPCHLAGQGIGGLILTGQPEQHGLGTQGGGVQGHVGGATRALFDVLDLDHGHRRLGGDPAGGAMPIAIQHDIANDQNAGFLKLGQGDFHLYRLSKPENFSGRFYHTLFRDVKKAQPCPPRRPRLTPLTR